MSRAPTAPEAKALQEHDPPASRRQRTPTPPHARPRPRPTPNQAEPPGPRPAKTRKHAAEGQTRARQHPVTPPRRASERAEFPCSPSPEEGGARIIQNPHAEPAALPTDDDRPGAVAARRSPVPAQATPRPVDLPRHGNSPRGHVANAQRHGSVSRSPAARKTWMTSQDDRR